MPNAFDLQDSNLDPWVVDALTPKLRNLFEEIDPELQIMTDEELYRRAKPTNTDYLLRVSFWEEVARAKRKKRRILVKEIYLNISSNRYWDQCFLANPLKVAWLARPIVNYKMQMKALHDRCLSRLTEVINLPFRDSKGQTNSRNLAMFMKAYEHIESRMHGGIIQQALVAHHHTSGKADSQQNPAMKSHADELRELDERIARLSGKTKDQVVIDVEPEESGRTGKKETVSRGP